MPGRKWGKKACQLGELAICPSAKAGLSSGGGTTTTKYKDRLSSWGKMGGRGKREGFSLWASTSPAFTCRGCNRTRRRKTRTEPSPDHRALLVARMILHVQTALTGLIWRQLGNQTGYGVITQAIQRLKNRLHGFLLSSR